jgi:hypothetical protein
MRIELGCSQSVRTGSQIGACDFRMSGSSGEDFIAEFLPPVRFSATLIE